MRYFMGYKLTKALALALVFVFSIQTSGLADVTDLRKEGQFDGGDALLAFFAGVAAGSVPGPGKNMYKLFAATYIAPVVANQVVKRLPIKNRWAKMVLQTGFSAGLRGAMLSGGTEELSKEAAKEAAKDEAKKGIFRRAGDVISRNARALGRNTVQMGKDIVGAEGRKAFVAGFAQGAAYAGTHRLISNIVDEDKNPVLANFLAETGAMLSAQFMGMALAKVDILPQGQTAQWKSFQKDFLASTAMSGSMAVLEGLGMKKEYAISASNSINFMINYAFNMGQNDPAAIQKLDESVKQVDQQVAILQGLKDGTKSADSLSDEEKSLLAGQGWGITKEDGSIDKEKLGDILSKKKLMRQDLKNQYEIATMTIKGAVLRAALMGVSSMLLSQISLKTSSPIHGAYLNILLTSVSATTLALIQSKLLTGSWGVYEVPAGQDEEEGATLITRLEKGGIFTHYYAQLGKDVARAQGDFMTMGQYQSRIVYDEEHPSGYLEVEYSSAPRNEAFFMPRYFNYAMTVHDSGFNEAMTSQLVSSIHNQSMSNLSNIVQGMAAQLKLTKTSPLVRLNYSVRGVTGQEIGESYGKVLAAQEQVLADFEATGINDDSIKALRALNEGKAITAEQATLLEALGVAIVKRGEDGNIQVDKKGRAQVESVNKEALGAKMQLVEEREVVKGVSSQAKRGPRLKGDFPFLEGGDPSRTLAGAEARGNLDEANIRLLTALVEAQNKAGEGVTAFNVSEPQATRLEELGVASVQRNANGEIETDDNGQARVEVNKEALDKKMRLVNLVVAIKSNVRLMGRAVGRWHEVGRGRVLEASYTKAELGLGEASPYAVSPEIKAEALAREAAKQYAANAEAYQEMAAAKANEAAAGQNTEEIHATEVSAATERAEKIADEMTSAAVGGGKSTEEIRKDPRWQAEFEEAKASQMRGVRSAEQIRQGAWNEAYNQETESIKGSIQQVIETQELVKVDIARGLVGTKRMYFDAWEEARKPEPVVQPPTQTIVSQQTRVVGRGIVHFDYDRRQLSEGALPSLKAAAALLAADPTTSLVISYSGEGFVGYADESGTQKYNKELSTDRAEDVKAEFIKALQEEGVSVPEDRITLVSGMPVSGAGEVEGWDPKTRAENRKVEFTIFRTETREVAVEGGQPSPNLTEERVAEFDSPLEGAEVIKHVVRSGETLSSIGAKYYGSGATAERILRTHNAIVQEDASQGEKITSPESLQVGQEIYITVEGTFKRENLPEGVKPQPAPGVKPKAKPASLEIRPAEGQPVISEPATAPLKTEPAPKPAVPQAPAPAAKPKGLIPPIIITPAQPAPPTPAPAEAPAVVQQPAVSVVVAQPVSVAAPVKQEVWDTTYNETIVGEKEIIRQGVLAEMEAASATAAAGPVLAPAEIGMLAREEAKQAEDAAAQAAVPAFLGIGESRAYEDSMVNQTYNREVELADQRAKNLMVSDRSKVDASAADYADGKDTGRIYSSLPLLPSKMPPLPDKIPEKDLEKGTVRDVAITQYLMDKYNLSYETAEVMTKYYLAREGYDNGGGWVIASVASPDNKNKAKKNTYWAIRYNSFLVSTIDRLSTRLWFDPEAKAQIREETMAKYGSEMETKAKEEAKKSAESYALTYARRKVAENQVYQNTFNAAKERLTASQDTATSAPVKMDEAAINQKVEERFSVNRTEIEGRAKARADQAAAAVVEPLTPAPVEIKPAAVVKQQAEPIVAPAVVAPAQPAQEIIQQIKQPAIVPPVSAPALPESPAPALKTDSTTTIAPAEIKPAAIAEPQIAAPAVAAPAQPAPAVITAPAAAGTSLAKPTTQFSQETFFNKAVSKSEGLEIEAARDEVRKQLSKEIRGEVDFEIEDRMKDPKIQSKVTVEYADRVVAIAKKAGLPEGMLTGYKIVEGRDAEGRMEQGNMLDYLKNKGLSNDDAVLMSDVYYRVKKQGGSPGAEDFRKQAYEFGLAKEKATVDQQVYDAVLDRRTEERLNADPALMRAAKDRARNNTEDFVRELEGMIILPAKEYEEARSNTVLGGFLWYGFSREEAEALVDLYLPPERKKEDIVKFLEKSKTRSLSPIEYEGIRNDALYSLMDIPNLSSGEARTIIDTYLPPKDWKTSK